MNPIVRIPAAGPIFGWNRIHFDQYIKYLRYPPNIVTTFNWKHDIRLINFNNIPHL